MQTWVVRILINECHNIQNKRKKESPLDELPERTAPPWDVDYELHDALMDLDEAIRLPLLLYYAEGYTTKEIARILRLLKQHKAQRTAI
jgi:RNA polymerase sigma-70 factor (ECF subfamily)